MKLIGHKYLNTQKKNNQRDQHGYQWKLKKNKRKDHQEHLWHKMSWVRTPMACGDKRGSAEVAVAGEGDVGDDFARNTFCLVLGNM